MAKKTGRRLITLVNVFTADESQQEELIDLLVRATEETLRHLPGFASASVHQSVEGTKLIDYTQWRTGSEGIAGVLIKDE